MVHGHDGAGTHSPRLGSGLQSNSVIHSDKAHSTTTSRGLSSREGVDGIEPVSMICNLGPVTPLASVRSLSRGNVKAMHEVGLDGQS